MAAFGFTRRSVQIQVAARAAAYLVCAPLAMACFARLFSGSSTHLAQVASLGSLVAALVLARPMLDTDEARRAFGPNRFRRLFLAGGTAMTSVAMGAAAYSIAGLARHSPGHAILNGALAIVLLVSVRALLSMRAWGLLLGAVTSFALLALTPFSGTYSAVMVSLAAAPALILWVLPLVIGWAGPERAHETGAVRHRIAEEESASVESEEEEADANVYERAALTASTRAR
jgi:hypothetical protein